ncbi:capsular exopolysaccharide family [Bellilinea caldifistulae]|nr:capsular exopolysaccharide family [Bellilinea caldifistulae]
MPVKIKGKAMNIPSDLSIQWFFQIIKRRLSLIASLVAVAIVVLFIVMKIAPSTYRASVTLLIQPSDDEKTSEINTLMAGERLALTYSQLMTSRPILEKVLNQNQLDLSVKELEKRISVQPIRDTQLIRLSVTDSSPSQAQLLANSLAATFVEYIQSLSNEQFTASLSESQQKIEVKRNEIAQTQHEIGAENQASVEYEIELLRLNMLISENRAAYQSIQSSLKDLQFSLEQVLNEVDLVESAQLLDSLNTPPYTAVLTVLYDEQLFSGGGGFSNPQSGITRMADGSLQLRPAILEQVIAKLDLNESSQSLQSRITLTPLTETRLIRLRVKDNDPQQAVQICQTIGDVLITQTRNFLSEPYQKRINSMENELKGLDQQLETYQSELRDWTKKKTQSDLNLKTLESELATKNLELRDLLNNHDQLVLEATKTASLISITEPAALPDEPTQNWLLYGALVVLVTFFIAFGLVFFLEISSNPVVTPQNVAELCDIEPVGIIGHNRHAEEKIVIGSEKSPEIAEDFKKLAAEIQIEAQRVPLHTLLITSPAPQDGKTFVAANLGLALSRAGMGIIIVDADLHLPQLHRVFGIEKEIGLADALSHPNHSEWLKSIQNHNLKLMTSGEIPANPVELLSSPRLQDILKRISKESNLVLIDCPPLLALADASYLSAAVDGVLLVLRSEKTNQVEAKKALSILKKMDKKYIGIVLNDAAGHFSHYYWHYRQAALEK